MGNATSKGIAFLTLNGSHSQRIGSHSSRSIKQSHWNEFFRRNGERVGLSPRGKKDSNVRLTNSFVRAPGINGQSWKGYHWLSRRVGLSNKDFTGLPFGYSISFSFFRKEGKEKWKSFVLVNRTRTWFSTENAPPFRCEISSSSDDAGVVNQLSLIV